MALRQRAEKRQPWQRFTLLDMLLVQAGFGLGFSLAFSLGREDIRTVERVIAGIVFGSVLAGPIVLFTHRALRGRRTPLLVGEWLWLVSAVFLAVFLCLVLLLLYALFTNADEESLRWYLLSKPILAILGSLWLLAAGQTCCFFGALPLLIRAFLGRREPVREPAPCGWTHWFGIAAAGLWGIWLWYLLLAG